MYFTHLDILHIIKNFIDIALMWKVSINKIHILFTLTDF